MEHIERNMKWRFDLAVFVVWTAFLAWLVFLTVTLVREGWHLGITGVVCLGVLLILALNMSVRYAYILWTVFADWLTVRLKARYTRKYQPHAQDELYLRKAYNDAATLESFLSPLYLERWVTLRADILYQMLGRLESGKYGHDIHHDCQTEDTGTSAAPADK